MRGEVNGSNVLMTLMIPETSCLLVLVRAIIKHGAFAAGSEARPLLERREREVCMCERMMHDAMATNGWIFHFLARGGKQ